VIHPIEGTKRTQDEYRELTVGKIRSMLDMIGHDQLNVHLALEINQFKMIKVSPGYTYDGILDIVTEVNSDHLGICFDLGHTYSNIRRGFLPPVIPDAFLRRVIHTHIHDLSPEYQTHWPLLYGNVPVGKYLKLLAQGHFKGILNLELIYDRFYTTINAKQAIDASLAKLNAILYKEEQ
jgi:sugar phosphate isomerase/epimerase